MSEYTYTEEVLAVTCDVCHAAVTGRCLEKTQLYGSKYRSTPHRERVWKAKGYEWYCQDCDSMVPTEHIVATLDEKKQVGSCRAPSLQEVAAD